MKSLFVVFGDETMIFPSTDHASKDLEPWYIDYVKSAYDEHGREYSCQIVKVKKSRFFGLWKFERDVLKFHQKGNSAPDFAKAKLIDALNTASRYIEKLKEEDIEKFKNKELSEVMTFAYQYFVVY